MKDNKRGFLLFVLAIATILYFMANFQRIAIPGAIFDILTNELDAKAHYITAFGAIFMYVYAFGQLVTGVMVDRYGGYRVIACGGIIFALGCVAFPLTNNLALMYVSRGLMGLGCSMFYLSLIKELKNLFTDKNYGIALSVMLFIGYLGAIAANAPFVAALNFFSWREFLLIIAAIIIIALLVFIIMVSKVSLEPVNKNIKLRAESFIRVLHKPHNRHLFSFACCNFGISYVIQTVIGKKFLEDFCLYSTHKAAIVLSIMAIIAAAFNIVNATVCKLCHNHRVIFLKGAAIITFLSLLTICIFLFFNIRSDLIAVIFCIIGANASISSIIIPVIQQSNNSDIAVTAVSIMNFCFFTMVGVLGSLTGILLNIFSPEKINGVLVYGREAYLTLFGTFLLLSVYEIYKAVKLSNHY